MFARLLIALIITAFVLGFGFYYWADIQTLLVEYNIELGGVGSIASIIGLFLPLFIWVFLAKKKEAGSGSIIHAEGDVVIGNKKEVHHYAKDD